MSFNPVVIIAKGEKPAWYLATAPYARANWRSALWQLANPVVPYAWKWLLAKLSGT